MKKKFKYILYSALAVVLIGSAIIIIRPIYCGCFINWDLLFHFYEAVGGLATLAAFIVLFTENVDQQKQINELKEISVQLVNVTEELAELNIRAEKEQSIKNLPQLLFNAVKEEDEVNICFKSISVPFNLISIDIISIDYDLICEHDLNLWINIGTQYFITLKQKQQMSNLPTCHLRFHCADLYKSEWIIHVLYSAESGHEAIYKYELYEDTLKNETAR